jgi:hypothetical protein
MIVGETVDITLLVSQITPVRHSDLPNEGMRAEALMLVPAPKGMPPDGAVVRGAAGNWLVESAVPLDRADQARAQTQNPSGAQPVGVRLYQVLMLRTADDQSTDDQSTDDQSTDDQSAGDQSAGDQSVDDGAAANQPAAPEQRQ